MFSFLNPSRDVTKRDLRKSVQRSKFSDHLPWVAYDEETNIYVNNDDTVGFLWECSPMFFAGGASMSVLDGLFRLNYPEGTIMQFILFADPHITPIIEAYKSLKTRENPLIRRAVEEYSNFLLKGADGMENMSGIPLRNFRLFFSIKMPAASASGVNIIDLRKSTEETLAGARLLPELLPPSGLLDWMRRIMNDRPSLNNEHYDDHKEIRKQVIFAETPVKKSMSDVRFGKKQFRCITPKGFPKEVYPYQTNQLFGGIQGLTSDSGQIRTPFIYTMNIVVRNMYSKLHGKCNVILQQGAIGSFLPKLKRRQEEHLWATDELEKGTKFYRIIPTLWVYGENETLVNESLVRARILWEAQGYVMQEDRAILPVLFIASLPFGLYDMGRNLDMLERDHVAPAPSISPTLPIQGDFAGVGKPVMLLTGRKGQVSTLDVFDKGANNHNGMVCAASGSGKSFLLNFLSLNYYACDAKIRIVDIGKNYQKMTKMVGAKYLDFTEDSDVCLNPFTHVIDPNFDLAIIAPIVAQMIYSSSNEYPSETEMTLIKNAIKWAYEAYKSEAGIDTVYNYLENFSQYYPGGSQEIGNIASKLAFNLTEFTSHGPYGRFFNGHSNFDISKDDFCVLELEHLTGRPELFRVVTLQVLNLVTQDLYLSDRSQPRIIIFDEAWKFLNASGPIKEVIEEGYRRARRYGGSFWIVTQQILDVKLFGSVGDVIFNNSAFKFFLESGDFEKAKSENLIDYDDFTMEILKGVKSKKGHYSEMFLHSPFGVGVVRLAVDPFSYYINTSSAPEIAEIEALVDNGMSYVEACEHMVKKYRS